MSHFQLSFNLQLFLMRSQAAGHYKSLCFHAVSDMLLGIPNSFNRFQARTVLFRTLDSLHFEDKVPIN